jgi:ABC-type multidrug transport system fused ATPase/permease subunit
MIYYSKYKSNFIFRIERELSTETLSIYLNKSFENFKQINSAFIARDILGEMSIFRNFLIAISLLIVEILDVVGILFIMFYTNFYSTLASIIFIITTSSLIIIYIRKKTTFIVKRRQKIEGLRLKETNLILQNYKYIKVNQLEIKSLERAYKLNNELSIILSINDFLKNAPKYILEFLGIASVMIYVLITFYTIGKQNLFENITPLIIFLYGSIKLMPSANRILSSINTVTFSKTTVNKLYDLFYNRPPELLSNKISFNKSITFDKVSFKYRDSDIFIYKDNIF